MSSFLIILTEFFWVDLKFFQVELRFSEVRFNPVPGVVFTSFRAVTSVPRGVLLEVQDALGGSRSTSP